MSRPSYPPAVFDVVEELVGRPLAGVGVADVGAGTGIATVLLYERGADVIGIEPGDGMVAQFHTALPIVRGDGNALPLADASVDLITGSPASPVSGRGARDLVEHHRFRRAMDRSAA